LSKPESVSPQRPTIWFEVEDFIRYFDRVPNPSGIQRVQMEIFSAVRALQGQRSAIGFCRLDWFSQRFEPVEFETLTRIFEHPPLAASVPPPASSRSGMVGWIRRQPQELRVAVRQLLRRLRGQLRRLAHRHSAVSGVPFRRGDVLLCTGAAWDNARYGEMIARLRRERGVAFSAILYDLIPLTHPQWVGRGYVEVFRRWLLGVVANADLVLAISGYSRSALIEWAGREKAALPRSKVLPLGTGFRELSSHPAGVDLGTLLPPAYALYVSTLEPRKNHRLLLRVWRRLLEKHGEGRIPPLVLAGRRGWMIDDLLAELERTAYLGGKIILLPDLADAQLREAYRRSIFSVFPSFVEGWGLPVAESLEQGKLCIASNRASIPEVGGELVDYIDPEDEEGALAAVERAIFDDEYRRGREARIRAEYRPASWAECVEVLLASLDEIRESRAEAMRDPSPIARESVPVGGASP